jgi:DNA-binding Lrp family transcriptional regulator
VTILDGIDRLILAELQTNGRKPSSDIADRVGLSPSACHRRIKALESAGVIEGYVAVLNPELIGRSLDVFVEISLTSQSVDNISAFEKAVHTCPEVMSCHLMAGDADYLVHLAVADPRDFERIHTEHLSRLPSVTRLKSSFAIRTVVEKTEYEL